MRSADYLERTDTLDGISSGEGLSLLLASLAPVAPARGIRRVLLSVSGGPDSLALLLLAAENLPALRAAGYDLVVATVDHQLRAASADEARTVARLCRELGLSHHTLPWIGTKPSGNLAAEAREARYRLLVAHAEAVGARAILTAHHQDDQIETHFLAAARGAGDRGLAGMRAARLIDYGILLLRPFLDLPGCRLKATTAARGVVAVDDPSNRDLRFDRARLRVGLRLDAGERAACLARIAVHARRRDIDDAALRDRSERLVAAGALRCDAAGRITLAAEAFRIDDHAIADRLLGLLIRAAAGAEHIPSRTSIRSLARRLGEGGKVAATLGGASVQGSTIYTFKREYGRTGVEAADPSGRCSLLFDRRFKLFNQDLMAFPAESRILAFGAFGKGNATERTLPVLASAGGEILAVPAILRAKVSPGMRELGMAEQVSCRLFSDLYGAAKICTKS